MKKIILISGLVLLSLVSNGQSPFPSSDEIKQFLASKTCLVLEDDPFSSFNAFMKKAVTTYWNLTPVEVIDILEFNRRWTNPAYYFIVLTQTNHEKDKTGGLFNFVNLLQGKKVSKLGELPEICAVPVSWAGEGDTEYGYKLGAILAFMQKHAKMISDDPSLTGRRYLKYYNKNVPEVSKKTILVKEEDLDPELSTIEKIKNIYPYPVKIVSEEEIEKAITEKSANTLVLHKVGPVGEVKAGYCFKILFGADDADMYYYSVHMYNSNNANGMIAADWKRLARF